MPLAQVRFHTPSTRDCRTKNKLEYNFRLCKISWTDERSLKGQECDTVSQKSVLALNVQYQVLRFLYVLFVVLLSFLLLSSWIFIASRSLV